ISPAQPDYPAPSSTWRPQASLHRAESMDPAHPVRALPGPRQGRKTLPPLRCYVPLPHLQPPPYRIPDIAPSKAVPPTPRACLVPPEPIKDRSPATRSWLHSSGRPPCSEEKRRRHRLAAVLVRSG